MQVGSAVQTYLPDDLNPKIKEQLDNGMGVGQGVGGPPGPPPPAASSSSAAASAPAKKQAANGSRKKSQAGKAGQQEVQQAAAAAQRSQPQAQDHALPGWACQFVMNAYIP